MATAGSSRGHSQGNDAVNAKLAELGAELRQAREAQKRSLEDLSRATLVHIRHLAAIEEGRDEDLPEPFYVKHFIRKYAGAVGLQPDELASRYWETQALSPVATPSSSGGPALTVSWWLLPVLFGALMLGIVGTLAINSLHHRRVPSGGQVAAVLPLAAHASASAKADRPASRAQPGSASVAATGPSPQPPSASASIETVIPGTAIAFQAHTTEASWMDIVSDGKEVFSDVVPAGHTVKWGAKSALTVRIGNPGSVFGVLDSRPLGLLGNQTTSVFRHTFLTAAAARRWQLHTSESRPAAPGNGKPQAGNGKPHAGNGKPQAGNGKSPAIKVEHGQAKAAAAGVKKPSRGTAIHAPKKPAHRAATGKSSKPAHHAATAAPKKPVHPAATATSAKPAAATAAGAPSSGGTVGGGSDGGTSVAPGENSR